MQLVADKLKPYPIHSAINPTTLLRDRDVDSNKLLRDRNGGLWIGTQQRGLIHIHKGRTDVCTNPTGSQATSAAVYSKTAKATFGSPPREDSTAFESSPSPRFQRSKVFPAMLNTSCSPPQMEAFG